MAFAMFACTIYIVLYTINSNICFVWNIKTYIKNFSIFIFFSKINCLIYQQTITFLFGKNINLNVEFSYMHCNVNEHFIFQLHLLNKWWISGLFLILLWRVLFTIMWGRPFFLLFITGGRLIDLNTVCRITNYFSFFLMF